MRKMLAFAMMIALCGCDNLTIRGDKPIPGLPSIPTVEQPAQNSCPMPSNIQWDVRFSPNGGATSHLVEQLGQAKQSIYVQAYSFTSQPIADALVAAKARGVHVEVILDRSDKGGKGTMLPVLTSNVITVYLDEKHAIAHNKIMIVDKHIVFTGSFNFTSAAEHSNAENSLELIDTKIAEVYQNNWDVHKGHSVLQ
jgi:phosphatidylserine/phosphatidylglycerophosphate/cardiolipin synthase-like enzyme